MGARYPVDAMALAAARDDVTEAHRALTAAGVPEKLNGFPMKLRTRIDILAERAGVAAGPQATPQVLWEGPAIQATHRNSTNTRDVPIPGRIAIPPWARIEGKHGQRVRVVAAPTSQETDHG